MKNLVNLSLMLMATTYFALVGCEKNDEPKLPIPEDSIFTFAAIGHQWIMGYDTAMPKVYDTDTLTIVSCPESNTWLMNDSSFMYCSPNEFKLEKEGQFFTVCKANAKVNDEYEGFAGNCKVVAIDIPVSVPAGTFNCFKIERRVNEEYRETYYVNLQYGLVKDENAEYICYLLSTNFNTLLPHKTK